MNEPKQSSKIQKEDLAAQSRKAVEYIYSQLRIHQPHLFKK